MNKGKKILIIGFSLIGIILIYLTIMYFTTNNKLIGEWSYLKYNVYKDNKLINSFPKEKEINLIFNDIKVKSVINIDIKNEVVYFYKINNKKLYYSVNEIDNNYSEYDYYNYKIVGNKLYIYIKTNEYMEEYIFIKNN